jgi:hypothetical protein
MQETAPLVKAAFTLRPGAWFDVYYVYLLPVIPGAIPVVQKLYAVIAADFSQKR